MGEVTHPGDRSANSAVLSPILKLPLRKLSTPALIVNCCVPRNRSPQGLLPQLSSFNEVKIS